MRMHFLLAGLVLAAVAWAGNPASDLSAKLIDGCQGEGCGCIKRTKTTKAFELFAKRSRQSKRLGSFPAGTEASQIKVQSVLIKPGKLKVQKVDATISGVKPGDLLTRLWYAGEGEYNALRGDGTVVTFDESLLAYDVLEKSEFVTWTQLKVGTHTGYAFGIPFEGCLE